MNTIAPSSQQGSTSSGSRSFARSGNVWNTISLVMTLMFSFSVVLFRDVDGFFDSEWRKEGFCISNESSPFWTSHDTAFYADVILSILIMILYMIGKAKDLPMMKTPYISRIPQHVMGIVAHGFGHFYLADTFRRRSHTNTTDALNAEETFDIFSTVFVGLFLFFWIPILYSIIYRASIPMRLLVAFLATVGQSQLPFRFAFTYVQSVIMIAVAWNELTKSRQEKEHYEYALIGPIIAVPVVTVGWVESLFCSAFYKAIGGHVWYDATIGLCILNYFLTCYQRESKMVQSKKVS